MKKSFGFLLCAAFVLSGCGQNDKLTCNINSLEEGIELKTTMVFLFEGDSANKVDVNISAELSREYAEYKDQFISTLKGQYANFEKEYGIKLNTKETQKGVILSFTMMKDAIKGTYESTTRDEVKEIMEKEGYTCK